MPLYSHRCGNCGHSEDFVRTMAESGEQPPCPVCSIPMPRDIVAEHGSPRNADTEEYYSDALGVHPNQIAEARKLFPHHEFDKTGRMRIKNARHRAKVAKELGYVEYTKNDLKYG